MRTPLAGGRTRFHQKVSDSHFLDSKRPLSRKSTWNSHTAGQQYRVDSLNFKLWNLMIINAFEFIWIQIFPLMNSKIRLSGKCLSGNRIQCPIVQCEWASIALPEQAARAARAVGKNKNGGIERGYHKLNHHFLLDLIKSVKIRTVDMKISLRNDEQDCCESRLGKSEKHEERKDAARTILTKISLDCLTRSPESGECNWKNDRLNLQISGDLGRTA